MEKKYVFHRPDRFFLALGVGMAVFAACYWVIMDDPIAGSEYAFSTYYNVVLQSVFLSSLAAPYYILTGFIYWLFYKYYPNSSFLNLNIIHIFATIMLILAELIQYNIQAVEYLNKQPEFFYYEFIYISNPGTWFWVLLSKKLLFIFLLFNIFCKYYFKQTSYFFKK
jgi:hypothetical protein